MILTRRILIQMAVFIAISVIAIGIMAFGYMRLPNLLFGAGHYRVTLELPETGGLYPRSNVTYRGSEIGKVTSVELTDRGAEATLSLETSPEIPADLKAEVRSMSAVGEQFVELLPRTDSGPFLSNALQWAAFGVIALIGIGVFIYREAADPRPPDDHVDAVPAAAAPGGGKPAKRAARDGFDRSQLYDE